MAIRRAAKTSIQDPGSIGELVAAVATVGTLAYLAVQLRQNTRALRSSKFRQIGMDMSLAGDAISLDAQLASGIHAPLHPGFGGQ